MESEPQNIAVGEEQVEILAACWCLGVFAFQEALEFPGNLKREVLEGSVVEEQRSEIEAYQKSYSTGYKGISKFGPRKGIQTQPGDLLKYSARIPIAWICQLTAACSRLLLLWPSLCGHHDQRLCSWRVTFRVRNASSGDRGCDGVICVTDVLLLLGMLMLHVLI